MSLKHAILGFLSFQSFTGYDLKKAFDKSVQHFWPANQSQIYRTLAKMTTDGLIEQEIIQRKERLDMKLYHITPVGQEELHEWLSTPLPPTDYREPFLIQLYFGGKLKDDELIHILQTEIKNLEDKLAEFLFVYQLYQEQYQTVADPRSFFLSVLTMEGGIDAGLHQLTWLKDVVARVEVGEFILRDFQLN